MCHSHIMIVFVGRTKGVGKVTRVFAENEGLASTSTQQTQDVNGRHKPPNNPPSTASGDKKAGRRRHGYGPSVPSAAKGDHHKTPVAVKT